MADSAKSTSRSIFLDTTSAQVAVDKLTAKMNALDAELAKTNITAQRRIDLEKQRTDAAGKRAEVEKQIEQGLGATYLQQQRYVADLTKQLKGLAVGTEEYNATLGKLKQAQGVFTEMKTNISGVSAVNKELGGSFGVVTTKLAEFAAGFFVFDKLKEFLSDSIAEANKQEAAMSRLQNTLHNLGREDVFDVLKEKAEGLSKEFGTFQGDEVIEVFQKLITYGKLTENQINTLTPVIINFAAQQRITLSEATDILTKALEGNSRELKTYGINLTDAKTTSERFGVVMEQLAPKVEGAAKAFGETTAGEIAKTTTEIDNLKEEIGTELQPVVREAYKAFADGLSGLKIIFNNVIEFFSQDYEKFKVYAEATFDYITFRASKGAEVLANYQAELLKRQKEQQQLDDEASARRQAESIAADAATKSIKEQEKILQQNIALQNASGKAYNDLILAGKQNTDEGHKAYLLFLQDSFAVAKLQESIDAQKNKNKLGTGNDDSVTSTNNKLDSARKSAIEFLATITDAYSKALTPQTFQPAIAAIEKFEEIQAKLNADLKSGIITQEEYNKGLDEATKTYNEFFRNFSANTGTGTGPINKSIDQGGGSLKLQPADIIPDGSTPEEEAQIRASMKAFVEKMHNILAQEEAQQKLQDEATQTYIQGAANEVLSVVDFVSQSIQSRQQRNLNTTLNNINKEKTAVQSLYNSHLITYNEYQRRVAAVDAKVAAAQHAAQLKQFEASKKANFVQALINGALAITQVFATIPKNIPGTVIPNPQFIAALIQAVATNATQAAFILAQKPNFAKGGVLPGPTHAEGGMPVYNPRTGRVVAEIEGGEPILSRKTYRNNKPVIDALLYSSMYQGGRTVSFPWLNRNYQAVNYDVMLGNMQRVRFADGGILPGAGVSTSTQTDTGFLSALQQQQQTLQQTNNINIALLNAINNLTKTPLQSVITHKQITDADDLDARIKNGGALQ